MKLSTIASVIVGVFFLGPPVLLAGWIFIQLWIDIYHHVLWLL